MPLNTRLSGFTRIWQTSVVRALFLRRDVQLGFQSPEPTSHSMTCLSRNPILKWCTNVWIASLLGPRDMTCIERNRGPISSYLTWGNGGENNCVPYCVCDCYIGDKSVWDASLYPGRVSILYVIGILRGWGWVMSIEAVFVIGWSSDE